MVIDHTPQSFQKRLRLVLLSLQRFIQHNVVANCITKFFHLVVEPVVLGTRYVTVYGLDYRSVRSIALIEH
jgi:hypothetical protein